MPLRRLFGVMSAAAGVAAMVGGLVAIQSRPVSACFQAFVGFMVFCWVFEPFEPSPRIPFLSGDDDLSTSQPAERSEIDRPQR